jgi:hypothetical protein
MVLIIAKLFRGLRRLYLLPGFLRHFVRSPEGQAFRRGEISYAEALRRLNEREQLEHDEVMDGLSKKEWSLRTRLGLTERKCERVQADIDDADRELAGLSGERDGLLS